MHEILAVCRFACKDKAEEALVGWMLVCSGGRMADYRNIACCCRSSQPSLSASLRVQSFGGWHDLRVAGVICME